MHRLPQPKGKYREIVFATALFVVFDLAVLVLNFFISYQIESDAVSINLAGRQRMLSQRMVKSLLTMEIDASAGKPISTSQDELRSTTALFSETLEGFRSGRTVRGGDGKPVALMAVDSAAGRAILDQADAVWKPLSLQMDRLLASGESDRAALAAAVANARRANLELLELMNALTSELESTARHKADRLRAIQAFGIVLALLNFAFIVFKFVRRLNAADEKAMEATRQTEQILDTVREGLFLLTPARTIGGASSASLSTILGHPVSTGMPFLPVLAKLISADEHRAASDFIDLLFSPRVRENLIWELNPLSHLQVTHPDGKTRHLTMSFRRVVRDNTVESLLVTVHDISSQVALADTLDKTLLKATTDETRLLATLHDRPAALASVAGESATLLKHALPTSDWQEDSDAESRLVIDALFRAAHVMGVRAISNHLPILEEAAKALEAELRTARDRSSLGGDEFDTLRRHVNSLIARLEALASLGHKLSTGATPLIVSAALQAEIGTLAARLADAGQKLVNVKVQVDSIDSLAASVQTPVRTILLQMIANAILHGIEPSSTRQSLSKPAAGHIAVSLSVDAEQQATLMIRDDGQGMDPAALRQALVDSGRYSPIELEQLSDRQVVMKVFDTGFSTSNLPDAGHGVGLDVVKQCINDLGGHLRIASTKNEFTEFDIRFPV